MGQIIVSDAKKIPWQSRTKNMIGQEVDQKRPNIRHKVLSRGDQKFPGAQIAEYPPSLTEPAHSHPHSELLYLLRGEVTIGESTYKPGMLVFIEKDTVYGPLTSGTKGVRFLRIQVS